MQLTALINAALPNVNAHVTKLKSLTRGGAPIHWKCLEMDPREIINAARETDLNLVYFFCHARGAPEFTPPIVEFSRDGTKMQYSSDRFQLTWTRKPLIILNGCSTAAFTPKALSPFVRKFTRDGEAGGVLATEIPVHQNLATEVAGGLLQEVLDGEPVANALLAVRRSLLAQGNPLGLAYTLFAFVDLTIRLMRQCSAHDSATIDKLWRFDYIAVDSTNGTPKQHQLGEGMPPLKRYAGTIVQGKSWFGNLKDIRIEST